MFLNPIESVEKPCNEVLSHPVQCFQEMFLATPAFVGSLFLGVGGFAVAVAIWGAIFVATGLLLWYVLQLVFRGLKFFFHQTRVGQKIASLVPFKNCLKRFCCKAQDANQKEPIDAQETGDSSSDQTKQSIYSKLHFDTKMFKSALKHVPFNRKSRDNDGAKDQEQDQGADQGQDNTNDKDDNQTGNDNDNGPQRSPAKTPQRSTSRLSNLTPKLLSPRSHK